MRLSVLSIVFFLVALSLCAQEQTDDEAVYYTKYPKHLFLKVAMESDLESFIYSLGKTTLNLEQNSIWRLKFNLNYGNLGFSFAYTPDWLSANRSSSKRGQSNLRYYKLRFLGKQWMQELYYRRNTGYFVRNTKDFNPNWKAGEAFIVLPEWRVSQYGLETWYVFNPHFSIHALYNQNIHQVKTAGSFVMGIAARYQETYPGAVSFEELNISSTEAYAQVNLGYYYTYILNDWFISAIFYPGIGLRTSDVDLENDLNQVILSDKEWTPYGGLKVGIGAGYHEERWLAGIQSLYNQQYSEHENGSVLNSKVSFNFFVGYRFSATEISRYYKKNSLQKGLMRNFEKMKEKK